MTAERFHALHHGSAPLLLPNAWDQVTATALLDAGFLAVGTTSLGVALAAGLPDAEGLAREATLALARGLVRLPCPVSVDIEGGFSEDPAEVAALCAELADLGVAGVNLEDGRSGGTLVPVDRQERVLEAVRRAAPRLFLNARTDTCWLGVEPESTSDRLRAYAGAGADGVFVPGLSGDARIAEIVDAVDVPVNLLYRPGAGTVERLGELGVRRVSTGSLLFRASLGATVATALAVRAGAEPPLTPPSYAEAQALIPGG
ncbi:phosphonomutase [Amycolatopsis antarctica]|uniref:Phosphonomutase n=1 Tax=Amycolatopsis antarctica TaxID=1854586 RepID=A0A263D0J3_9PSEU|nr:isocitrate lyase/phosphoenolpyruvate mutase family protein [Amycolatopsis antarctica]OZM71871.1 phosphonomutase [Amycolatopsis antarctica]